MCDSSYDFILRHSYMRPGPQNNQFSDESIFSIVLNPSIYCCTGPLVVNVETETLIYDTYNIFVVSFLMKIMCLAGG